MLTSRKVGVKSNPPRNKRIGMVSPADSKHKFIPVVFPFIPPAQSSFCLNRRREPRFNESRVSKAIGELKSVCKEEQMRRAYL